MNLQGWMIRYVYRINHWNDLTDMADVMTPEQRHKCMAAVKGKDTKPELIVRKYLFSKGLRFRVQVKNLPGRPDIALPKYKTVIFVNGCFWHGHEGCKYFHIPKSNVEFWKSKIERNIARDNRNEAELKALGWRVIRVWECDIRKVTGREEYLNSLYNDITQLEELKGYDFKPVETPLAAEPEFDYGISQ